MKNAFGYLLPEINEIVKDASVQQTIQSMLLDVLAYLDISSNRSKEIVANCLQAAGEYQKIETYEEQAHCILEAEQVTNRIPEKLSNRASLMYKELSKYLLAGNVLDYGCGDGKVGEYIAKNGGEVALADVYTHRHVAETGLPFCLFGQGQATSFADNSFSNTLALTVFHHCSDPLGSVRDVYRVTKKGGRVIVIESVFGVDGNTLPTDMKQKIAAYLALNAEQQRNVNVFFDHFYNRVLHYSKDPKCKVNVPFNFNTPENWRRIFEENRLLQEAVVHLGLDQPTAPEYHTLQVLRKT
jgi:SAM-dependent methyltransferase